MKVAERDAIPALWGEYRGRIMAALNHSLERWDEATVLSSLLTSPAWLLWIDPRFAAVTRVIDFPKKRVCEIILLGGENMAEWEHHEETLCAWAQSIGCKEGEIFGRLAWARKGEKRGWKVTGVRLTKEL